MQITFTPEKDKRSGFGDLAAKTGYSGFPKHHEETPMKCKNRCLLATVMTTLAFLFVSATLVAQELAPRKLPNLSRPCGKQRSDN